MTKYQREGDWLVEVSERKPPTSPNYSVTSGGIDTGSPHQPPGLIEYTNPEWDDYERHLSSLKRLRISPELAAHLGDRMEVTSEEIEVKSRCCGRCDGKYDICVSDETCEEHLMEGCEICFGARKTAFPAKPKQSEGDEVWEELRRILESEQSTGTKIAYIKSKYKITKR